MLNKIILASKSKVRKKILDKNNILDLNQLISLINNSSFVISNDTGPAHICSHLDKRGLVLFGSHTTAKKVSIENYSQLAG